METAFKAELVHTVGELPQVAQSAPDFELVSSELAPVRTADFSGRRLVLNIFSSVDTGTCAASVRRFNELAVGFEGTDVLCVSKDLPFAQARFCGAEGIENVSVASAFRSSFGDDYGVRIVEGPMTGLLSRAVVVVGRDGRVLHSQQVGEISEEPDYDAALAALG